MPVPNFCPRCGKPLNEKETVCSNCGLSFEESGSKEPNPYSIVSYRTASPWQEFRRQFGGVNVRLICFGLLAAAALVLAFWSASEIAKAAGNILTIRTDDGKTVNEVYYREMGTIYNGFAIFVRACGVFFAGVLVRFGLKK